MLLHYIKKFPEQFFLFLFNSGVFALLKRGSDFILTNIDFTSSFIMDKIPKSIQIFTGNSLDNLRLLIQDIPWVWLIFSMIIMFIYRFMKGLLKGIIFIIILIIGFYLLLKNRELLNLMMYN